MSKQIYTVRPVSYNYAYYLKSLSVLSLCVSLLTSVYQKIYTVRAKHFLTETSKALNEILTKHQTPSSRHQNCTSLLQQLQWLPISERIKYKTACMCYNAITGSAFASLLSYYTFTVLPALSALRQTHACSNSNASTAKPMAFAFPHTLAPTSGTMSPKTSGTLLLSFPTKAN